MILTKLLLNATLAITLAAWTAGFLENLSPLDTTSGNRLGLLRMTVHVSCPFLGASAVTPLPGDECQEEVQGETAERVGHRPGLPAKLRPAFSAGSALSILWWPKVGPCLLGMSDKDFKDLDES